MIATLEPARRRLQILTSLYGHRGAAVATRLERLLAAHRCRRRARPEWDARDVWLITYPDQFRRSGEAPLRTLHAFFETHLSGWMNGMHVLPFFPWSSDDGFAVIDLSAVDPRYGSWDDVERLDRRLVIDAVVNHASAESPWFRRFLEGDPEYAGFFVTANPTDDLSKVVRPRTTPLLTRFTSPDRGDVWVWTTFSPDQVDLDYHNPDVLLNIIDVLLDYADHGASVLRLDAVAYLWKEPGTSCIHLPQTHALVELFRLCLEEACPGVKLLTETNVPHEENVSYFGTAEHPEAHIVYQFPLAPLVLHAFATGDASKLSEWAATVRPPRPDTTFLNFLASHDGVGVRPAEGLLTTAEIGRLCDLAIASGGGVGERRLPDGTTSPYELNATWLDLLGVGHDEMSARRRHVASHEVMFALQGIPAVYVHSLFGTSNDVEAVARTGEWRAINRRRFAMPDVEAALHTPGSRERGILDSLRTVLRRRRSLAALSPDSGQQVLDTPPELFGVDRGDAVRVLVNVSDRPVPITAFTQGRRTDGTTPSLLAPWSSLWLMQSVSAP